MDSLDKQRKRLLYQAKHRGMQETDLLLGRFADQHISTLGPEELQQFEALLDQSDIDLLYWITGQKPTHEDFNTPLMDMIKNFRKDNQ